MTKTISANHAATEQLYLDGYPVGFYYLLFEVQEKRYAKTFIIKK